MIEQYPNDLSLEQVLVEHRKIRRKPNLRYVDHTVLREGPRSSKVATIFEIVNQHTGELHHFALKLETFSKTKLTNWKPSEKNSLTLGDPGEGSDESEIGKLMTFIASVTSGLLPDEEGRYVIINSRSQAASELLKLLQNVDTFQKLELALNVLDELTEESLDFRELQKVLSNKDSSLLRGIAVASKLVEYRRAYEKLKQLIECPHSKEQSFQQHLKDNPWMFGSEYSELLDRRAWTRDEKLDFMQRRTVDGYLEIVEIKTPEPRLFTPDESHHSYVQSSALSQAIGQVIGYIEQIDRDRDTINARDKEDPLKIRARIIIGRDGNEGQQAALRNLNAHLNRIEIITYDQLLRIAERVLKVFEDQQDELHCSVDDLSF